MEIKKMTEQELWDKIRETADIREIDYKYLAAIIKIKKERGDEIYFALDNKGKK